MVVREAVRLVVWDLDETFWQGTLTEGGITQYIQDHQDIVIELARRGIMSSICSKNDLTAVKEILENKGIWDYFVFPSIDWTPKAQRIAAIIEAVQLRPQTVMFIDDSPSNRAEAAAAVAGLQVADPTFIPDMLADPHFRGKNDDRLTRLAQYKLLEKRALAQARSGADVIQFLRASNIRVTIEVDIEKHIGRAVELVNRTNQLNFTKKRLPEDAESAAHILLDEIRNFDMQAGLIRVTDNYGDHGFCGFYVKSGLNSREHLVHYCFSCRILGMGVEKWLYDKFARPRLDVVGEVLTDLFDDTDVDWINVSGFSTNNNVSSRQSQMIPEIRLRGGCELAALAHYFSLDTPNVLVETAHGKDGMFVRIDSTANMMPALRNRTTALREEILRIGLSEADFASKFLAPSAPGTVLILSTWGDVWAPFYKHRQMDFQFGYSITHLGGSDLTKISNGELTQYFTDFDVKSGLQLRMQSRVRHLRENYDYGCGLADETLQENLKEVFNQIPFGACLFLILPYRCRVNGPKIVEIPDVAKYNRLVAEVAANYQSVELLSMDEFVRDSSEALENVGHFDRIVYFRMYEKLSQMISTRIN
jgi:FkbH-like protein